MPLFEQDGIKQIVSIQFYFVPNSVFFRLHFSAFCFCLFELFNSLMVKLNIINQKAFPQTYTI